MSTIAGDLINFRVRANGSGAAFKTMICTEDTSLDITNETSDRRTNCGPITGIADPTFTISGNAVHDFEPLSTQVSYNDVKTWQKNKTKLDFEYQNDADPANGITLGEAINVIGSGFFTQSTYNGSAAADGLGSFSYTFTGTGTIDEYDAS